MGHHRVLLWDIDNTLIDNAGVSKEIYAGAFALLAGRQPEVPARTEGRTDPSIMGDLLADNGEAQRDWPEVRLALAESGQRRARELAERGRTLPGVVPILIALNESLGVVQTVVTGNIHENARVKLGAFDLLQFFDLELGAYGSDDSSRSQLVKLAAGRATGGHNDADDLAVVVIGDTFRDVEAGRANGFSVLAVASGIHTVAQLTAAGADRVVTDLCDTSAILGYLLGR